MPLTIWEDIQGNSIYSADFAIREHYNRLAEEKGKWKLKNHFYHQELLRYHRFFIPEGSSILELGCGDGDLIGNLTPSFGIGVDLSEKMLHMARRKYRNIHFICASAENFHVNRTFDYVIISGTLGSISSIQPFFQKLSPMIAPNTRIIITHYNELWQPILRLAEKIHAKVPELIFNWLSIDDISNFLWISNYEPIRTDYLLLFPKHIPFLTDFLNRFLGKLPLIRRLSLEHSIVARRVVSPDRVEELTSSVIVTCRDEEGNIEGLVKRIPQMGKHVEIIFVEGHSKDNTVAKIKEMIHKNPEKDIKLLKQNGMGQKDAFRTGCDVATGDLLCWLEADLTIPPEEMSLFWDAYSSGMGEYINGTRFIYQMGKGSMPFLNFIGNRLFGNIFTEIFEQRITDTLCGFKAISRKNYHKIRQQKSYFGNFDPFGDFDLIFGAMKLCLKTIEIPVHYQPRTYGRSKAYGQTFLTFIKHAFLLFRMSWTAFKKFKLF